MDQSPQTFDQFTLPGGYSRPPTGSGRGGGARDPVRGLARAGGGLPGGAGWQPASLDESRKRAVPLHHAARGPAGPSERLRFPHAGEDLSPYLADLPDTSAPGNRLLRFEEARPIGALLPHQFPGYDRDDVEAEQMQAFEEGVERWWLIVPRSRRRRR